MIESRVLSDGEQEAWLGEIVRLARRFARRVVRRADVDDLVQEVTLHCLLMMNTGRWVPPDRLPGFVQKLVRDIAIDLMRTSDAQAMRDAEYERQTDDGTPAWASPETAVEETLYQEFHERTMAKLPAAQQRAFTMVREQGASYVAAAERLGLSRNTVQWQVVQAERRFVRDLAAIGIALSVLEIGAARRQRRGGE